MTEALLNNIIQQSSNKLSKSKNSKAKSKKKNTSGSSFSETMNKIKNSSKNAAKKVKNSTSDSSKVSNNDSTLDNQEFLEKLKKILKKNNKEVPSELLSLLQGGSLSKEQEAMLEKMLLNLENSNIDIKQLKSLLEKNSSQFNFDKIEDAEILKSKGKGLKEKADLSSLNAESLKKLAELLENNKKILSDQSKSKLKSEVDQLTKILMNSTQADQKLTEVLESSSLEEKLGKLASALKNNSLKASDLKEVTQKQNLEVPELKSLFKSENSIENLTKSAGLTTEKGSFEEVSQQLKQMVAEKNSNSKLQINSKLNSDNTSKLFSLNDNSITSILSNGNSSNQNESNFFDLDQGDSFVNFDFGMEGNTNNLNAESFSLNDANLSNLAKKADLKAQVVEQFKGNYSPETKEMQIQLKPESLGKIDLKLSYENNELVGRMLVESEAVRSQLENSLQGLKSDLVKQGINIEQFKVETAKNSPQQVQNEDEFAFNDQSSAFSDGETGENQEYEQRRFFQGQYYVQKNGSEVNLNNENIIMKQQEIINRAAFSNEQINLLA